jgi:hypothetical protein
MFFGIAGQHIRSIQHTQTILVEVILKSLSGADIQLLIDR